MTVKGTVTDLSWKSPHVHFDIDGKELDSPKIANPLTVNGYPASNGAKIVRARKVTLRAR